MARKIKQSVETVLVEGRPSALRILDWDDGTSQSGWFAVEITYYKPDSLSGLDRPRAVLSPPGTDPGTPLQERVIYCQPDEPV